MMVRGADLAKELRVVEVESFEVLFFLPDSRIADRGEVVGGGDRDGGDSRFAVGVRAADAECEDALAARVDWHWRVRRRLILRQEAEVFPLHGCVFGAEGVRCSDDVVGYAALTGFADFDGWREDVGFFACAASCTLRGGKVAGFRASRVVFQGDCAGE